VCTTTTSFKWYLVIVVGFFLNSGLQACKAGALPLELHFTLVILEMGSHELFPQADLEL
jgi:hypothetical protein